MKSVLFKFLMIMLTVVSTTVGCCAGMTLVMMDQKQTPVKPKIIKAEIVSSKELKRSLAFTQIEIDETVENFYVEWIFEFNEGKDDIVLKNVLESIEIEFLEDVFVIKKGFYMNGDPFPPGGVACAGRTVGIRLIQVWAREPPYNIGKTSLVHELIHVSIKVTTGKSLDPDHLGEEYSGWTIAHTEFIERFNAQLEMKLQ